ncbi:hypothetical protein GCM10007084_32090 [Parabacteroides faecis]|nr:hypothetical protein GCM10007084_32090 [Parabacteroides faecis]
MSNMKLIRTNVEVEVNNTVLITCLNSFCVFLKKETGIYPIVLSEIKILSNDINMLNKFNWPYSLGVI